LNNSDESSKSFSLDADFWSSRLLSSSTFTKTFPDPCTY
jgi:hypothetical protein